MDYKAIGKEVFEGTTVFPVSPKEVAETVKQGNTTAKDIASALGVPPAKVAPVLPFLVNLGVLERKPGPKPEGKRGKPPFLYSLKGGK